MVAGYDSQRDPDLVLLGRQDLPPRVVERGAVAAVRLRADLDEAGGCRDADLTARKAIDADPDRHGQIAPRGTADPRLDPAGLDAGDDRRPHRGHVAGPVRAQPAQGRSRTRSRRAVRSRAAGWTGGDRRGWRRRGYEGGRRRRRGGNRGRRPR